MYRFPALNIRPSCYKIATSADCYLSCLHLICLKLRKKFTCRALPSGDLCRTRFNNPTCFTVDDLPSDFTGLISLSVTSLSLGLTDAFLKWVSTSSCTALTLTLSKSWDPNSLGLVVLLRMSCCSVRLVLILICAVSFGLVFDLMFAVSFGDVLTFFSIRRAICCCFSSASNCSFNSSCFCFWS